MPSDRSGDEDPRRRKESTEMAAKPHVDGLARGTVVEYDGWQWGVVTEIAEEKEPTKVGFVLLVDLDRDHTAPSARERVRRAISQGRYLTRL